MSDFMVRLYKHAFPEGGVSDAQTEDDFQLGKALVDAGIARRACPTQYVKIALVSAVYASHVEGAEGAGDKARLLALVGEMWDQLEALSA